MTKGDVTQILTEQQLLRPKWRMLKTEFLRQKDLLCTLWVHTLPLLLLGLLDLYWWDNGNYYQK